MKILFAASEAVPFSKSGGLADVAGSLSKAVRNRGQACRVVLPLYEDIPQEYREKMHFTTSFYVPLGWRNQYCGVYECTHQGVKYYFLDNEYYFKRHGLYGFFDDAERFSFFSKAVLEMLAHIDFAPEIIHCHDWQTALIPVFLNVFYRHLELYQNLKTVFTIHNIQYQGTFDLKVATDVSGLPVSAVEMVEFGKDANFMKGAIEQCEALTTVSPSYAGEITDPWYAHGLHTLIAQKQYKLTGILNGIDTALYHPAKDKRLAMNYSADIAPQGKAACKADLQHSLGLDEDPEPMVIGMVSRLVGHKGLDIVQQGFDRIMHNKVQFVMLGAGDWQYEKFFREAAARYPGRVAVYLGYDDALAMKIYSGADALLMPSRSEPCGLSQLIAMRYGTLPIVRATGGLRDTVRDFGGEEGNGYNFLTYNADDMLSAVGRALIDYRDEALWTQHVRDAMACDFSWSRSAASYIDLYKGLLAD